MGSVVARKYRLERQIGEGGMGAVWEALHLHTKRKVALKLLLDRGDPTMSSARFMREARAASQVGHDGIVEVLDAGFHDARPYLALELLEGRTLEEAFEEELLTFAQVRDVLLQALEALQAAHEAGIVHRDIKPDNIFLCDDGDGGYRAKLLDFGIAKTVDGIDTKLTVTGTVMGTPAYMAPEQARGEVVDHRVDLWALAAVIFRAVVGRPAFSGANYNMLIVRILTRPPPNIRELRPDLPEPFAAAIEAGLQRDPALRVASAAEMAELLRDDTGIEHWGAFECTTQELPPAEHTTADPPPRQHDSGNVTLEARTPPGVPAPPARKPRVGMFVAAGLTLAVLAAAGAFAMHEDEPAPVPVLAIDPLEPEEPLPEPEPEPEAEPESEPELRPEPEPEPAAVEPAEEAPAPRARRRRRRAPSKQSPPARRGFVIEREYD